ncbi:hypothetical protein K6858_001115 [Vibrio parahaemolyticus]|nr:hypothetical protein [Vibrio parahaemolyticus]
MTETEIANAVQGIMAMRPEAPAKETSTKDPHLAKRMNEHLFRQEMESIMNDEVTPSSAYFFKNTDPSKARNKNLMFNVYKGSKR